VAVGLLELLHAEEAQEELEGGALVLRVMLDAAY
jgi:hypothetical protein